MALDLTRVASQVGGLLTRLKEGLIERSDHLRFALETADRESIDPAGLKAKLEASKTTTTWLIAGLTDGINGTFPRPPIPDEFTIAATDGSHIDVDRHRSARCFLINIGSVVLKYGNEPDALLESAPILYASEDDLVIREPGTNREQVVEGALLGLKRDVDEGIRLAELAESRPPGTTTLALVDGTLIRFGLTTGNYGEFVVRKLLEDGYLKGLDRMKALNADRKTALASYISLPGSSDVVNSLKVAVCPQELLNTDIHCKTCTTRECDRLSGIRDRDLFGGILGEGERSNLFYTVSKIVERYGDHAIYFYYLNVDEEIARVEIPRWVAENDELLNLTHGLILDQCRRGQGYPVALSEAHEQAVVTGADRENFWQLVEMALTEEKIATYTSAKSRSKNTRWV